MTDQPPPYPGKNDQGYPAYPPQSNAGGWAMPPGPATYQPPMQQQPQQPFPPMGQHQAFAAAQAGILKNDGSGSQYDDTDDMVPGMEGFSDKAIRRGFIKKVYSILMCQLILTSLIITIFLKVEPVKMYVQRNMWVYYSSLAVVLVCIIALACCESVRRKSPLNFIFLAVFTACEGVTLGVVTSFYDTEAVLIAVGITAGVALGVTIFAFQTKYDFTTCGGALLVIVIIFCLAGIAFIFLPKTKYVLIGYGCAGALIFSLYLIYDTQLMLGGKHKYSVSPEEYVFAALSLYLDVINIFLYILMAVGGSKK